MNDTEFQKEVDTVVARYQPELDRIEKEGKELGDDVTDPNALEYVVDADFDVEWKITKLSATVPTVTMRKKDISFDVPEVKMKTKEISFDVPEVVMKRWCVAKVPQGIPPKMKCMYAHKPEVRMKTKKIKTDIPEVRMKNRKFSIDVPEFGTTVLEIKITLPHFAIRSVSAGIKKVEKKGKNLQKRGEVVASQMEAEMQGLIAKFFGGGSDEETHVRNQVEEQFDKAIASVNNAITELKGRDIDPVKVPAKGGNINYRKIAKELHDNKNDALKALNTELETA
ncbi:hypothetical protein A8B75_18720 [Sphingomonadales bacterium EhC05]|nr:hypothetical protein A8B75_18720 [Sphingomonadales bacterium EhC05]